MLKLKVAGPRPALQSWPKEEHRMQPKSNFRFIKQKKKKWKRLIKQIIEQMHRKTLVMPQNQTEQEAWEKGQSNRIA